jgi:uncharacterized protein (DUF427 family)
MLNGLGSHLHGRGKRGGVHAFTVASAAGLRVAGPCTLGSNCRFNLGAQSMKAVWNGTVVAESEDTVVVEGNHYFPASALKAEYTLPSNTKTMCSWKGQASYLTLFVDGNANPDAVWFYPDPKDAAADIKGRVAFWKGVQVRE